ncbi:hypothetical protein PR202_gn00862 [Eleusine coracana subsp. coracana]|uniref:Uncharacterized protein n=1 Tax=Eleusine coracana subsp. coracana TaxID=191504 RepID=A0AAV5G555_ELECO|nr:hypothetical protein PR202_gn00862 [Eleusine coracana subsp. coracana]
MKDQANTWKNQTIHILHYQRNVDWGARVLISCLKMRDLDELPVGYLQQRLRQMRPSSSKWKRCLPKCTHINPADLERAKKAKMSTLNHIFRDYKSKLNCQYVKKNQTPFDKHGNISQQEWDEFVEQKTSSS